MSVENDLHRSESIIRDVHDPLTDIRHGLVLGDKVIQQNSGHGAIVTIRIEGLCLN